MSNAKPTLSIGQCATLACLLEVAAPKVGNVHRGADFEDLTLIDFAVSATVIAPHMQRAVERGVGATALAATQATRQAVNTNTNLGTVLLLAPLAAVPVTQSLVEGIGSVLDQLTAADSQQVYQAIRLAAPGGLGRVDEMDVTGPPPTSLLQAMRAAAAHDMVARQYTDHFSTVLNQVVPWLLEGVADGMSLTNSIVHVQLRLLAQYGDSLIARKCGEATSRETSDRAATVLRAGRPGDETCLHALAEFDFWLRGDHHRRNPGTTADLIAAGLFAALRDGQLRPPF